MKTVASSVAPCVGIIMGSDSDLPVMKSAAEILEMFGVPHEVRIVSAHKTPELVFSYASSAHERGIQVIIAGVGGAAHLAGMVVALTPLLVIGIPVRASTLDGIDSLLSIVQNVPNPIPSILTVGNFDIMSELREIPLALYHFPFPPKPRAVSKNDDLRLIHRWIVVKFEHYVRSPISSIRTIGNLDIIFELREIPFAL
ncbi:Phosphoribosylaminoimidazole carboxylase, chloroplastic [Glycine soja]|uniref:phosphoribosylaminoimidazole carboxylase n=1 Tax=Glycine soja TaxID=3848 RepID=A0A445M154_GLYSO|nr:Phosphoribosylaminoimidazole carboxylase, chloroplastic [Glycine soja]